MCHMKCMHVRSEFIKTIAARRLCRAAVGAMSPSPSRKFDMKADLDNTIRSLRNCRSFCHFQNGTCLHSPAHTHAVLGGFYPRGRLNPSTSPLRSRLV